MLLLGTSFRLSLVLSLVLLILVHVNYFFSSWYHCSSFFSSFDLASLSLLIHWEQKSLLTKRNSNLSCKNHCAVRLLNLLLGDLRHKLSLHHNRLIFRQDTFAQNLEVSELHDINHCNAVFGGFIFHFLRDQCQILSMLTIGQYNFLRSLCK